MEKTNRIKELRKQAMALPQLPGVYIMKDSQNTIIYIGKAKALKNRVSQYFGSDTGHTEKVRRMVSKVDRFEYIVTDNEFEALVLECSLIKQYSPKYNILLKDDKGYRYIRISPPPYSRISVALQKPDDGARYLGPYISGFVVKEAVDEVNRVFQLPTCNRVFGKGKRERPCLNHYIDQCCAPCNGYISKEDYDERIEQAIEFLTQGGTKLLTLLERRMNQAAENLEFEKAARLRDRIAAIRRLGQKQKVVRSRIAEQDVIALARGEKGVFFEVFRFKKGKLYDREDFVVEEGGDLPPVRSEFLQRYYSIRDYVPPQVTLDGEIEDQELTEQWLSEKAGRRVYIVQPQKGEQAQLVEMCRGNAAERAAQQVGIAGRDAAALDELARLLGLSQPPRVIESYDVSNTGGSDNVAGMVVFENGQPLKSSYRRFKIKTVVGQDDYGSMREVLTRRLAEYEEHKGEDNGFGRLPDLILLDGGRGHVAAVRPILEAGGYNVPVFGMVKDSRHRTRAISGEGGEIAINGRRSAFTLVSSIQEEVHRYAIAYHRQRRAKRGIGTVLTQIKGVGKVRAEALLRHFGSVKAIRSASADEITAVKGVSRPAADAIRKYFDENK
ncbi:MAG TPA: excinuclease ABC subunit UvrC [Ruminococcaceae bacterium]|nr:excinuclease ABC subunit UvrC [Oscillospiraceae bacterium]HCA28952.1 excinuclease ABC subunit UvrC [Oscillospiraceae bacterium]